jgi:short-subunit dehydrogenase
METLATRLRADTGVAIEILVADLTDPGQLTQVEQRLLGDERIGILVNNAGASLPGGFTDQAPEAMEQLIRLNVVALTRLASAATARFLAACGGSIINIGSAVGLRPEFGLSVYGATKAFVLYLWQALQHEVGPRGVRVQAVLPAATRTEIWKRSGTDVDTLPAVMEVEEMVDAALIGFDRGEAVTIPPLPDVADWERLEAARKALAPGFAHSQAASRYRS